jgi:hypothetical protein
MLVAITMKMAIIIECDELTMEFFSLLIENCLESYLFKCNKLEGSCLNQFNRLQTGFDDVRFSLDEVHSLVHSKDKGTDGYWSYYHLGHALERDMVIKAIVSPVNEKSSYRLGYTLSVNIFSITSSVRRY